MGLFDWFESFSDEQRVIRLRDCRQIERDLADCETKRGQPLVADVGDSDAKMSCLAISHRLWACRALALGCGDHLITLNRCFDEKRSERSSSEHEGFSGGDELDVVSSSDSECRKEQEILAACVTKNAVALEGRLKERARQRTKE